jgi:twitching motility protein PilT
MSQIQRLLDMLANAPGGALRLVADSPIVLVREGTEAQLTRGPITAESWRNTVAQLVPPFALAEFDATGLLDAWFPMGNRTFEVHLSKENGAPAAATVREAKPALRVADVAGDSSPARVMIDPGAPVFPEALEDINRLLRKQAALGASDLHLRTGVVPMVRRSGDVVSIEDEAPIEAERMRAMLHAIMVEDIRREYEESGDADFAYEHPDAGRFRINAFVDSSGPALVTRAIPSRIITADELGLSQEVRALTQLSKGLVLVTGPTGSGKSTTLSALVDLVNTSRRDHIITIEDPIEFVHQSKGCLVTQRQVGMHTRSFKQALRAALREDPDVVLVGELRDLETVSIAIETAETGHLVFGTLHTSTAPSTVDRIIDQFPPDRQSQVRVMLSESLRGVISQTLCRKVGGGRVAAMEILLVTPALSNLIREGKTFQMPSIMQTSKRLGMVTMMDALVSLVEKGEVAPQEAYLRAPDKGGIVAALKARGHDVSFAEIEAPAEKSAPAAARPVAGRR